MGASFSKASASASAACDSYEVVEKQRKAELRSLRPAPMPASSLPSSLRRYQLRPSTVTYKEKHLDNLDSIRASLGPEALLVISGDLLVNRNGFAYSSLVLTTDQEAFNVTTNNNGTNQLLMRLPKASAQNATFFNELQQRKASPSSSSSSLSSSSSSSSSLLQMRSLVEVQYTKYDKSTSWEAACITRVHPSKKEAGGMSYNVQYEDGTGEQRVPAVRIRARNVEAKMAQPAASTVPTAPPVPPSIALTSITKPTQRPRLSTRGGGSGIACTNNCGSVMRCQNIDDEAIDCEHGHVLCNECFDVSINSQLNSVADFERSSGAVCLYCKPSSSSSSGPFVFHDADVARHVREATYERYKTLQADVEYNRRLRLEQERLAAVQQAQNAMSEHERREIRVRQHREAIAHNILTPRCPYLHCREVFVMPKDFDSCFCLYCEGCSGRRVCGYCLQDIGTNSTKAHDHVRVCPQNTSPGSLFPKKVKGQASVDVFNSVQLETRKALVCAYLDREVEESIRAEVKAAIRVDLRDLGIVLQKAK